MKPMPSDVAGGRASAEAARVTAASINKDGRNNAFECFPRVMGDFVSEAGYPPLPNEVEIEFLETLLPDFGKDVLGFLAGCRINLITASLVP